MDSKPEKETQGRLIFTRQWGRSAGEHVRLGLVHEGGEFQLGAQSIDGLAPLGFGWSGIVLGKHGGLSLRFSRAFRSNSGG